MKYIKNFENLKDEPQVGDYVTCILPDYVINVELIDFIYSSIGQITKIYKTDPLNIKKYYILYNDIPISLTGTFLKNKRIVNVDKIIEFAKTKEDLEIKLQAKKYNL